MDKVKTFISKYKSELLIAVGAISSIVASIATMDGVNAGICSIVIAVLAVVIGALQHGFSESTINLMANAIKIIIDELSKDENKEKNANVMSAYKELTVEDIKRKLLD